MTRSGIFFFPRFSASMRGTSLAAIFLMIGLAAEAQSHIKGGPADVLGPHNDGARGCVVCHVPRSGPYSVEQGDGKTLTGLWGAISAPAYGSSVTLADGMRVVTFRPQAVAGGVQEVKGILLCLSCHDGNLTPQNMMQSSSYEHQMGLLGLTPYRNAKIASLLGEGEDAAKEHPLGLSARINPGNGLVWSNGAFTVLPGTPYAQFVANYGLPALAGKRVGTYGISEDGEPYAMCTTCHDQHVHSVYASKPASPIAGDGGGKVYTTYFLVNGPYNPMAGRAQVNASSAEQFCRQCHFEIANEGNNSNGVPTFF